MSEDRLETRSMSLARSLINDEPKTTLAACFLTVLRFKAQWMYYYKKI